MADNKAMGMLIDYDYCTGCHSCEVSCKERIDLAEDEWGIKLADNGPWRYSETDWEWNHVPIPAEHCDFCKDRIAAGKKALCELHCQALVITVGPLDELMQKMTKKKMVLFNETNDKPRKQAVY